MCCCYYYTAVPLFFVVFMLLLLLFNRLWLLFLMSTLVRHIELTFTATLQPPATHFEVCLWLHATNCLWKRKNDKNKK